ncbi:MAG: IS5 family transposase [Lachnospiraceae bacterium]|nr:IS5 family transposase [Lachnospiraceae bacterium]
MNNQHTLTDMEYSNRKKKTKREKFLDAMNEIIPWSYWVEMIRPYYFNNKRGRKPIGIEIMLRMYLMQIWFNLSDEGIEDSIYDSYAMRSFMHIDFNEQQVPDATTLLKFRHMLEKNKIGEKIFADVNERLDKSGLIMHGGTIVDASLIAAPKSTKNKTGERDPEMHQTKKGNEWYFGMKVHAGVDAATGYVHSLTGTSANMHDVTETSKLIRKDDYVVYGDSGYLGAPERPEIKNDEKLSQVEFRINKRRSSLKMPDDFKGMNWDKKMEHEKSAVRCKVEHPFLIVKRQMGYAKVVYKGIEKNMNRFNLLFATANLIMCSRAGRTKDFQVCGV